MIDPVTLNIVLTVISIALAVISIVLTIITIVRGHRLRDFRRIAVVFVKSVEEGTKKGIEESQTKGISGEPYAPDRLLGRIEQIHSDAKEWLDEYGEEKETRMNKGQAGK